MLADVDERNITVAELQAIATKAGHTVGICAYCFRPHNFHPGSYKSSKSFPLTCGRVECMTKAGAP